MMAKNSLQEKFQTSYPFPEEAGEDMVWAKDGAIKPAKVSGGYSANSIAHEWQAKGDRGIPYVDEVAARNDIPNWTDMQEATMRQNGGMRLVTASETDVSKVMSTKALQNGFTLHDMDSVDDQYTGENMDHFYGAAIGNDDEGNRYEGFVERNNYLDRI
jgi:hypothetical protein